MLENLGDIYHLSMIGAGLYLVILATFVVIKIFKKSNYKRRK